MSRRGDGPSAAGKYHVPALELSLDVIEELANSARPRSISDIAQVVEKSPGSLFRIMSTLERRGYVHKDVDTGHYSISLRLLQLAHRTSPVRRLVPVAGPMMAKLAMRVHQSNHLSVRSGSDMIVVHEVPSDEPIRLTVDVGARNPILDTLSGRVILAIMPTTSREHLFEEDPAMSALKPSERSALLAELDEIRERGYATRHAGLHAGVLDVSAPIGRLADGPVAALTVTSLATAGVPLETDAIAEALVAIAAEIDSALGQFDAADPSVAPRTTREQ